MLRAMLCLGMLCLTACSDQKQIEEEEEELDQISHIQEDHREDQNLSQ